MLGCRQKIEQEHSPFISRNRPLQVLSRRSSVSARQQSYVRKFLIRLQKFAPKVQYLASFVGQYTFHCRRSKVDTHVVVAHFIFRKLLGLQWLRGLPDCRCRDATARRGCPHRRQVPQGLFCRPRFFCQYRCCNLRSVV